MHKLAAEIELAITIPFVHIADTTAQAVRGDGLARVGLLATAYTMEQDFYVGRLAESGLTVLVPEREDRRIVHDVIYDELCRGVIRDGSRDEYRRIMAALVDRGAEGILLGCTEIDLLVGPGGLGRPGLRHDAAARRPRGHAGAGAVAGWGCGRRVIGIASAATVARPAAIAATMNASV